MNARALGLLLFLTFSVAIPRVALADDAACIAASEASLGLRRDGKLHDALKQLALCAADACPAEIKQECVQRIEAVRGTIPTLIVAAKDYAGNDLAGVKVTMDGAPLEGGLDGRPLSLDPGEHRFLFEAPGHPSVEKILVLRSGEKDRRETIVLGTAPTPVAPPLVLLPPRPVSSETQEALNVPSPSQVQG